MSQFDVHRNTGRYSALIPFVVIVQSAVFDDRRRRIVVPLVANDKARERINLPSSAVNPTFTVKGIQVILNPFELASVPVDVLGEQITYSDSSAPRRLVERPRRYSESGP